MSAPIKLVQGDTRPFVTLKLTNPDGGPTDLTGATAVVHFRKAGTTQVLADITVVVVDAPGGAIKFNFPGNTLDVEPGAYEGEVEITFSDATKQTVYDVLKFTVRAQFA